MLLAETVTKLEIVEINNMVSWMRILIGIAFFAILIDLIALGWFIMFRRDTKRNLDEQHESLEKMAQVMEIVRRHTEMAMDLKGDTQRTLETIEKTANKVAGATTIKTTDSTSERKEEGGRSKESLGELP